MTSIVRSQLFTKMKVKVNCSTYVDGYNHTDEKGHHHLSDVDDVRMENPNSGTIITNSIMVLFFLAAERGVNISSINRQQHGSKEK